MKTNWTLIVTALATIHWGFAVGNGATPETIVLDQATRERCLEVLRKGLVSEEFWPAMHAAEALTYAGEGAAVREALAKRKAADDQQQCGLAREAARAGDRSQVATLLKILANRESNGRIHAAESLYKVAEVGDGKSLREALAPEADARLRIMAAAALARSGHPKALDVLRGYLNGENVDLRKLAAWGLGQLGTKDDVLALAKQLAEEKDELTRANYVNALALLGDADARGKLGENLRSGLVPLRVTAAEWAGYCRATEFREPLVKLLDDETLDVRVRAAQSLLILSQPLGILELPLAARPENFSRELFPATAANPRYSEGSIIGLLDGSLLYATTEFVGGGADHATARIVARMSADHGRTWSDPRVLQENTGKQNVMSVTLRRLTANAFDGPLGMIYLVKNSPTDLKVVLRISNDEAQSFGPPILVTDAPGYHVMNNDRVTVMASGRMICPIAWTDDVFKKGGGHFVCFCYLSDDGGKTWRRSAEQVDQPQRGAMEPEVVELEGGELLMIIRTQLGKIATSRSTDGGEHWSAPGQFDVNSPESPATIRRIPATGDLLLVWNNTYAVGSNHGGKRRPLTAAVSSDGGQTWKHIRDLETDSAAGYAYTSVLFNRDRVVLSYYVSDEKTGRISSRFRSVPVGWFYGE